MKATLRFVALIVTVALLLPSPALAVGPDDAAEESLMSRMGNGTVTGLVGAFDVLILRPMGLVALGIGTAAFVPAAVLSSPGGLDNMKAALEIFILEPGKDLFLRPVGDF